MGFLDKVKANVQEAATMAREGVEEVQTKRELGQVYGELGRRAFDLIERGEIAHAELDEGAAEIRRLKAELEAAPTSE